MKYKCIIFDCDGVLVDSEEISIAVMVDLAKNLNIDIDMKFAQANFAGKSLKACFDYIEKQYEQALPLDFESNYRANTFLAFQSNLKPINGIHELIDKITIPYCVASNGPQDKIKLNLTVTNLLDYFKGKIFSAYDIRAWKPDPALFLYAAKNMGFTPQECAVIEDSESGVVAAIRGGFDVYALAKEHNKDKFTELGAYVFYSMDELYDKLHSHA